MSFFRRKLHFVLILVRLAKDSIDKSSKTLGSLQNPPFERELSAPEIKTKLNFTYSGMVLTAEATLSLDSFFFIALEAIFAKLQGFSKTKLDLCQSKALLSRQPWILAPVLRGQVLSRK